MMSQHIGLLMGSFNPIHIGHLALANYMLETCHLDEVWLVVSPQNPFKDESLLVESHHRLAMVNIALSHHLQYKACDIELEMPLPSYTVDTLSKLTELYPNKQFSIIMGSDNLQTLDRWKDYLNILNNHHLYIYPRPENPVDDIECLHPNITVTQAPLLDISSTFIRKMIKQGHRMQFFLPAGVDEYIHSNQLYQ